MSRLSLLHGCPYTTPVITGALSVLPALTARDHGPRRDLVVEWKPRDVDGTARLGVEEHGPPRAPAGAVHSHHQRLGRLVRKRVTPSAVDIAKFFLLETRPVLGQNIWGPFPPIPSLHFSPPLPFHFPPLPLPFLFPSPPLEVGLLKYS